MVKIVKGKAKNLLDKAKESCLLAVDVLNNITDELEHLFDPKRVSDFS
jgi:hypothetical protein